MHGLKQLVYDNQPFFSSNQTGKTNRELYILWKQNKRDDIFLLLYTQLWMVLEEVYMENVICLLYTSPSPRDLSTSRMPSSA